ncbi:Asp-tRNA(Asn)/Glu-tRNA(Gln) amidotransferase subunit GatC [bacterium]|nr:Asp-tRNA(Asn)/Glu-tRNA(Gln) amidotransferase subunit GatC [bacterium]
MVVPEITEETVKKIARLANLRMDPDETARFTEHLEKVLEYMRKLNQLDTTGIPQTAHVLPLQNVWREDEVLPGLDRSEALAGAPDVRDDCFRVPRIIE